MLIIVIHLFPSKYKHRAINFVIDTSNIIIVNTIQHRKFKFNTIEK